MDPCHPKPALRALSSPEGPESPESPEQPESPESLEQKGPHTLKIKCLRSAHCQSG